MRAGAEQRDGTGARPAGQTRCCWVKWASPTPRWLLALLARLCGLSLAECTGAGTGLDAAGIERKRAVLQQALDVNAAATAPLDALAALGGYEVATMVGAVLQAAAERP